MARKSRLEVWGGVECATVRIGDEFRHQLDLTGHADRLDDLDLIASAGIRTLRYPILWERIAPDSPDECDWSWADQRLLRLRDLGIRPIVGLLHHGSGPRTTNLLDPRFPQLLAGYTRRLMERYPWVDLLTPINEPLTTARFSGLYGHWYPHDRTDHSFARALVHQCQAVAVAMREARLVNPTAGLVQTEDLAYTRSTAPLRYQAEFDNHRRWITFDLLCGKVTQGHPLWNYLLGAGIGRSELEAFEAHPLPPQVIGLNYYVTSERFLDHRWDRYPAAVCGGNGLHRYADVEAVRAIASGLAGPRRLMLEAWQRYNLPIAVTEVHHGCTREEQLRWLMEIWCAATSLRRFGVDIVAVTAWSLFGACDWNSLMLRADGHYEPGCWDIRGPFPRSTALTSAICDLVAFGTYDHPVLDLPGWWHRAERLLYPVARFASRQHRPRAVRARARRTLLILGAAGALGQAFTRLCAQRGIDHRALTRGELDIEDSTAVTAILDQTRPWAVINAAGRTPYRSSSSDSRAALRAHAVGAEAVAKACATRGIRFIAFSADLVFDGTQRRPYVETDMVNPVCADGESKAEVERRVLKAMPGALIVRTSACFGPWDDRNYLTRILRSLASRDDVAAATDHVISPTYLPHLADATLDLLIDGVSGIWHLANDGAVSWYDLAFLAAQITQAARGRGRLLPTGIDNEQKYTALGSERGALLPPLHRALHRYAVECSWL